jgi:hypothetical protein
LTICEGREPRWTPFDLVQVTPSNTSSGREISLYPLAGVEADHRRVEQGGLEPPRLNEGLIYSQVGHPVAQLLRQSAATLQLRR